MGITIGIGIKPPTSSPVIPPTPYQLALPVITDGNTMGWFEYQTGITKDGSNHVTRWNDALLSGRDLQNGNGTPHHGANGILFDGIADALYSNAFVLIQPIELYLVVRQVTWTNNETFFDGIGAYTGCVQQYSSTPNIYAYAGGLYPLNPNLAINTWGIVRVVFNGASSEIQVDATASVTGNFGAGNMGGLTLGALGNITAFGNVEYKEVLQRRIVNSVGNRQLIMNYLKAKYSL